MHMEQTMTDFTISQVRVERSEILGAASKHATALIWVGALLLIAGVVGTFGQVMYSFISIGMIGAMAILGGVLQAVHATQSSGWKSVSIQWIFALFYIAVGVMIWMFPIPALGGLTIWLAAMFFVTGALRLIQAFQHHVFREWFWLLLSSALSILMGFLILKGWPSTSLWVPGLLLAIEFMLQGWGLIFLGIAAKSISN